MKRSFYLFVSVLFLATGSLHAQKKSINWMTWEEAIAQSKKDSIPKKMFIDFYTSWCGWCKRMDASTFVEPNVVSYMNANFYPVKFDAETRDTIVFNGTTFMNSDPEFVKASPKGRGKVHTMAYSLLDGSLSYPSYVILDENQTRLAIYKGFKQPNDLLGILLFFATNQHQQFSNYLYSQWNKQLKQQAGDK